MATTLASACAAGLALGRPLEVAVAEAWAYVGEAIRRATEVELSFTSLGPALTRVSVEHRGWEHLSEEQLREDCAAPGGYSSGAYSGGWAAALAACVDVIESTHP